MQNNPSNISVHQHLFGSTAIEDIMRRKVSNTGLRNDRIVIIVDSEQLITQIFPKFVRIGGSNTSYIRGISDDTLRMGMENSKIGYISEKMDKATINNNQIVTDYFNMNKIKLLLATFDIIKWPVNGIRALYLSRIPMERSNNPAKPDLFKLAEIINKVGGDPKMDCEIYAQTENINLVIKALNLTAKEYADLRYRHEHANDTLSSIIFSGIKNIFK